MNTRISTFLTALALTVTGIAHGQSPDGASAGGRASGTVTANSAQGAAVSQTGQGSVQTAPGTLTIAEGTELNAKLTRGVDARRARPGDEVRAEIMEDVEANGQVVLSKGTRLVGRVTEARPHVAASGEAAAATASQLAIVFDRAILGRGREVPIQATIQALAAAEGQARQSSDDLGSVSGGVSSRSSGGAFGGAGGVVRGGVGAAGSLGGAVGGQVGGAAGVAGGAAGTAGGAAGTAGGAAGTAGGAAGAAGGVAGNAAAQTGGSVRGAAGATGAIYRSRNAVGGLDAAGRLSAGSRGVFGIDGLEMAPRSAVIGTARAGSSVSAAGATVITSANGNVRLDNGTRMLLVASGGASGSASVSR